LWAKSVRIFNAIREHGPPSIRRLAEQTGLSKSSVHRHWFARLKRQSIVVSKSLEMVDLTMALYAKFHVNGDDTTLLQSLQF
jgi:DNA-binding IclR family transcriptional regulator